MQKKLLALLLSGTSCLAIADTSIFGKVNMGMENDNFPNTFMGSAASIQDYGSYFGIKGDEKVYGNNSVIWQIEQHINLSTGTSYNSLDGSPQVANPNNPSGHIMHSNNTLASDDSFIGGQGQWGKVRMGILSNYARSDMGNVDANNYGSGVNGLGIYGRTSMLLSNAIRYDSPTWNGLSATTLYAFDSSKDYNGGIWNIGLGYGMGNFSANWSTQVWENVGTYQSSTGIVGPSNTGFGYIGSPNYNNAYVNRFELGYNDPVGLIANIGFQSSDGLGWWSWANSGGSVGLQTAANLNSSIANQLTSAEYITNEVAVTAGYHFGAFLPKISYAYGANIMTGGNSFVNMFVPMAYSGGNQIADTGYQQLTAELDWSISPQTLIYANAGMFWAGSTWQNVSYNNTGNFTALSSANNGAFYSQDTIGLGISHSF